MCPRGWAAAGTDTSPTRVPHVSHTCPDGSSQCRDTGTATWPRCHPWRCHQARARGVPRATDEAWPLCHQQGHSVDGSGCCHVSPLPPTQPPPWHQAVPTVTGGSHVSPLSPARPWQRRHREPTVTGRCHAAPASPPCPRCRCHGAATASSHASPLPLRCHLCHCSVLSVTVVSLLSLQCPL